MNEGLSKIHEGQFFKWAENETGDSSDTIDIGSEWDKKLSLEENKAQFSNKYLEQPFNQDKADAEYKEYAEEMYSKMAKPKVNLREYYTEIFEAVEKAKMGFKCLIFVKGMGGIGKSYQIKEALDEFKMDYAVFQEVTQATIPVVLHENKDKVIWIKDVAKILNNPIALDLMKAATEMNLDKDHKYLPRKISVKKFSHELRKAKVPDEFEFNGIIIFDYNALTHKNYIHDYMALKQRGEFIDLAFSRGEMMDIMRKLAFKDWEKEVTEYLIENTNKYFPLNLRLQQDGFVEYLYSKLKNFDWKVRVKDKVMERLTENQIYLRTLIGDGMVGRVSLERILSRTELYCNLSDRTIKRRIDSMIRRGELFNVTNQLRNPSLSLHPQPKGGIVCAKNT